ncbi:hypothetical protein TNCV_3535051 [Trichonephila clavipes]|nr:hypothetical protein TNCV_3535051 [Trichonephila clavipes]
MKRKSLNKKRFPIWEWTKYGKHQTLYEMFKKGSVLLDCLTVSLKEFVVVHEDNACTAPIMAAKNILEFVQCSKDIIEADSEDEKEMHIAVPEFTSSEIKNITKSLRSNLEAHFKSEMNNKIDEQILLKT